MNELLTFNVDTNFPIDGRELHAKLGVETAYKDWFPRMCEYGFAEGIDYEVSLKNEQNPQGGRPAKNHLLTLSMAKELCMLQRTDLGRQIRRYLIDVEQAWNTPEQVMARALRVADATIMRLNEQVLMLQSKADYFDQLVDRNLLTSFRETAKEFGIKERAFVGYLIEHKYVYRDKKGKLMPCTEKNNGLFELKECVSEKTAWAGTQTLITPKGRETFRLLMQGLTA